jgi:hypothetical protein
MVDMPLFELCARQNRGAPFHYNVQALQTSTTACRMQVIAASITTNEQSAINSQLVKLRIEVEKLLI